MTNILKANVLLVDDNVGIHEDFMKILLPPNEQIVDDTTKNLEEELFGIIHTSKKNVTPQAQYSIKNAYQGEEAITMVENAEKDGSPFSLAFVDVRMPPGIDGIQTIKKIWNKYPTIEMVICTAYSDYSWDEILSSLESTEHLFFMKKPFDPITLQQTALTLATKSNLQKLNLQYTKGLEDEVNRRTAELNQMIEHLKKMKAKAEQATISKTRFLSTMSHEIRTPLHGILGMNDLLLDTELSDEQKTYSESIKDSSNSLLYVVNDVLDYSKIEAGKLEIEQIRFNLRKTVENVLDIFSVSSYERGLEIGAIFNVEVPEFFIGDPGRIRQVLTNLISNAIKFTNTGEVLVSVSFQNKENSTTSSADSCEQVLLRIEVSDTGIGMHQETVEKLFNPFTQADASTNRTYGGSGLGLAISKQLCELMQGDLRVQSVWGKGSQFFFVLPLTVCSKTSEVNPVPLQTIEPMHCMVFSDNQTSRKICSLYLKSWKCSVVEAQELHQATTLVSESKNSDKLFNCIVVDLHTDDLTIYERVSRKFKSLEPELSIPLICLNSIGQRGDAKKISSLGYTAYLTRPLKQSHLYKAFLMIQNKVITESSEDNSLITKHFLDEVVPEKYHVLVVDDNKVNQKIAVKMLQKLHISADVASNGIAAVEAIKNRKYNLILMDCIMPKLDGFKATEQIRNMESTSSGHLPIIGLSANAFEENRIECLEAGMDDFLSKPFNHEGLITTIRKYLGSKEH